MYSLIETEIRQKVITWEWIKERGFGNFRRLLSEWKNEKIREMWSDWQKAPKSLLRVLVMFNVRPVIITVCFSVVTFSSLVARVEFMENWNELMWDLWKWVQCWNSNSKLEKKGSKTWVEFERQWQDHGSIYWRAHWDEICWN